MSRSQRSMVIGSMCAAVMAAVGTGAAAEPLEEVVVTARKTAESLQSAPVAVTAFTAKTIAQQGLVSINDFARYTPGLSFSQAFGRTTDRPVIRGQSNVLAGVQFGVESGTAYFIDGVYFPGDIQGIDLNAIERIEVIKGPQSALYGRNTYAGAINYVTRPPSEKLEATVKASFAQHHEHDYAFSVAGSMLGDTLGLRLYARDYSYGGEYKNTLTGATVGDESTRSVGLALHWRPTEDFTAAANVIFRDDRDGSPPLFLQGARMNNCKPGYRSAAYRSIAPGSNPNQYYCGVIQPGTIALNTDPLPVTVGGATSLRDGTAFDGVDTQEWFSSLNLNWDVMGSGWTVTSLSGYRDYTNRFGTDSDHSPAFTLLPNYRPGNTATLTGGAFAYPAAGTPQEKEPLFGNTNRDDVISKSTELRIASPKDRRLRGMLGYYYYDYKDDGNDLTFADPKVGNHSYTETVRDTAVFGLLAYDITPVLTLTAEVRKMEETKTRQEFCSSDSVDFNYFTGTCTNLGPGGTGAAGYYNRPKGLRVYQNEAKFKSTTPRITLDWRINPDAMIYGTYSKGAKPGGLNGSSGISVGKEEYDQEKSDNFELGTKLWLMDRRLRFNAAAFVLDATNVQFTQALPNLTGSAVNSIATNQGKGRIYGLELETEAAVTDALSIRAGYAYTRSEITKGCDDFEYVLNTGGIVYDPALGSVKACDISGHRYPLGPEQTANLAFNYDAPLKWGHGLSLVSNLGIAYEGSKYVQVHELASTGESTLVDLRLGIRSDNGWSLIAFGRNLTDEDTIPLATRWFDLRTGSARVCNGTTITTSCIPANLAPVTTKGKADGGSPRAFFGSWRRGRSFGIEFRYDFKL